MSNPKDDTIERLIAENTFANRMIAEAKIELSQFGDIDGMTFLAAVKKIVAKYNDSVTENFKLKDELSRIKKILDKQSKT